MESIRILVIDEHPLFRQGCRCALEGAGDCTIVGEASESRAGLEMAKQHTPDVVLIDALLSTNDALELARQLRHASPRVAIVMLTAFEDEEQLFQSMKLGAAAYFSRIFRPKIWWTRFAKSAAAPISSMTMCCRGRRSPAGYCAASGR